LRFASASSVTASVAKVITLLLKLVRHYHS
jgi:hypothetical protein